MEHVKTTIMAKGETKQINEFWEVFELPRYYINYQYRTADGIWYSRKFYSDAPFTEEVGSRWPLMHNEEDSNTTRLSR